MVVMEAVKQQSIQNRGDSLFFFRDQNGRELDLILEKDRRLTPIEIKSSATWNPEFARQILWFQALSSRSEKGLIVYSGDLAMEKEEYSVQPFRDVVF